ncbi:hypothetical protein PPOP_3866, partial [Paenibacillus popilliae ATCC 14706]
MLHDLFNPKQGSEVGMDALLERCAGLDVHQETVVACVLAGSLDKK